MTDTANTAEKVESTTASVVAADSSTAASTEISKVDTAKAGSSQSTESKNEESAPDADSAAKESGSASNVAAAKPATVTSGAAVASSAASKTTSTDSKDSEEDLTNLIINYLPPTMSEGTLATLFSPYGLLERCKIVVDLQTLRSRGYGFVKYDSPQSAERALQALNGYELNGKKLKVAYARKQCKAITNANLYITNVPPHFVDNDLFKLFQDYGKIVECRILCDQNGVSRGVGFVRMDTHHNAIQALQAMDQYVIDDKNPPLLVKLAQRRIPKRYWNQNNRNNQPGGMGMGMGGGNKRNQQQKGGMGRGGNRNLMNKGKKNQYYSPKGRMGMDGGQNMGGPMGQNQGGLGGQNKNSPTKRGYYRAKNQFNKSRGGGQNQAAPNQQNTYSANAARRSGGGQGQGVSAQSGGGAPFYPAPMYDTHHAPYGAQMAAQYAPAAYPNIPMTAAAAVNPSGGVGPGPKRNKQLGDNGW
eukprot:CAMPEP_0197036642 /NCGR_PEP_ID=MMETSP1384-20130603/14093_1 /TAXON_ID=29189 /ORGANISM="Ammonia sp." /LENGTH=472 /DNA_ID=CAMNT_0042466839 /DNA_START=293 /DNA_END=1708 /DNA_ORIENTATION=+